MASTVATPAEGRQTRIGGHVARAALGVLIGVIVAQLAMVIMSLASLNPQALPGRLYFMVEHTGGVSAFAAFAATGVAVWLARRLGGRTAAFAAVAVLGVVAAFSLYLGSLCLGLVCDLPAVHYFGSTGHAVAVFLTGFVSLFLHPNTRALS